MHVKMLDGKFKGEIRDLRNDVAMELMAAGRAARPYDDVPTRAAAAVAQAPKAAVNAAPAKKKAGR